MSVLIETEANGLLNVIVSNLMTRKDVNHCQETVVTAIKRYGNIKVLMVLDAFQGWETSDEWKDFLFYAEYEDKIKKIAVLGDLKWKEDMFSFLSGPFRSGLIEFFNPSQKSEARTWLE
jgi:hypothetical protein